jgi:hypothetical protein
LIDKLINFSVFFRFFKKDKKKPKSWQEIIDRQAFQFFGILLSIYSHHLLIPLITSLGLSFAWALGYAGLCDCLSVSVAMNKRWAP